MEHQYNNTSITVSIRKNVMDAMYEHIGKHEPERGGYLFGTISGNVCSVELFVVDSQARVSGATFTPSAQATEMAQEVESKCALDFVGVVHSHPRYIDCPSVGDLAAMNSVLQFNSRMPFVLTPIISLHYSRELGPHEKEFHQDHSTKISFFLKEKNRWNIVKPLSVDVASPGPTLFTFSRQLFAYITPRCEAFKQHASLAEWSLMRIKNDKSEDCVCARFVDANNADFFLVFSPGNELRPSLLYEGPNLAYLQQLCDSIFAFDSPIPRKDGDDAAVEEGYSTTQSKHNSKLSPKKAPSNARHLAPSGNSHEATMGSSPKAKRSNNGQSGQQHKRYN